MLELNKIYCGDCLEIMGEINDKSIDLVVTSPPYDNLRDYKGYTFNFEKIAQELFRVIKDGGVVVWVVGDATKNGTESGTSFKQALYFKEIGFNLHDTMIYHKPGLPNETDDRYRQDFEYMFALSRGKPNIFNPLTHRRKFKDTRTVKNINKSTNGEYKESTYRPKTVVKDGNIFSYVASGGNGQSNPIAYQHPATFPEQLAYDQIFTWTNEDDIVLDPMCGSGTTCKQAFKLKRKFIGIDISEEYCEIGRKQLAALPNTKLDRWFQ